MNYPKFFDEVPSIELYDPLSDVLGSFNSGVYEITYKEVVKMAGHSCPTVGGAYLMTLKGLKALYPGRLPVRGEIKVEFKEDEKEGVAGVIGNVISNITGATTVTGFKGLNGNFARHSLMFYNSDIDSSVRFTRLDTNKSVDVYYDHSIVPADFSMQELMPKVLNNTATDEEKKEFGKLWQTRVKRILIDYADNPQIIRTVEV